MFEKIYSNPSSQRSFEQLSIVNSELKNYLKLQVKEGIKQTRDIFIFPGLEYNFTFIDAGYGKTLKKKGLVTGIYRDQIVIKSISNKSTERKKHQCKPIEQNQCNCVFNPPDTSDYDEPITYNIPLCNILMVEYVTKKQIREEEDIKVMLLGITAETVKAIIIKLSFFDDCSQDAIKYIELKVGNTYDFTYEDRFGTIYDCRGKITMIESDENKTQTCKPGKGFVREYIGCGENIYTYDHGHVHHHKHHEINDFMQQGPVSKVKIAIDTSEDYNGQYEYILLSQLRDCTLVSASEEPEIPSDKNCNCCKYCKTCQCNKDKENPIDPPIVDPDLIDPPKDPEPDTPGIDLGDEELDDENINSNTYTITPIGETLLIHNNITEEDTSIPIDAVINFYTGSL